jgi:transcription elongation factor/antiterminator RfaH
VLGSQETASQTAAQPQNDSGSSMRWYVAETHLKKEDFAAFHLERQSFRSLCPRFEKVVRHARRTEKVLVPLFPGYVFVAFDIAKDGWRSINGTLGVRRLIGFDSARPQPVPDDVVRSLLGRFDGRFVANALNNVQIGDAVRITSGPFAEKLATVESLDGKGRARVLLDILGGQTALRLNAESIASVDR